MNLISTRINIIRTDKSNWIIYLELRLDLKVFNNRSLNYILKNYTLTRTVAEVGVDF